jgi:hypothetical protein
VPAATAGRFDHPTGREAGPASLMVARACLQPRSHRRASVHGALRTAGLCVVPSAGAAPAGRAACGTRQSSSPGVGRRRCTRPRREAESELTSPSPLTGRETAPPRAVRRGRSLRAIDGFTSRNGRRAAARRQYGGMHLGAYGSCKRVMAAPLLGALAATVGGFGGVSISSVGAAQPAPDASNASSGTPPWGALALPGSIGGG